MPVVSDASALLSGDSWNGIEVTGRPVIVTYSFPTSAPAYIASVGGFTPSTVSSFQAFTAQEQAAARQALGEWSAASGLVFIEVAPGQGDINFQNVDFNTTSGPSYSGAGGIAFYPFGNWNYFTYPSFSGDLDASGDVFMNSQFLSGGTVEYGTLLHEIGHAIGLKHPTEVVTDFAANPAVVHDQVLAADDPALTVMATVGDGSPGSSVHLKDLDRAAASALYGPAGTGAVVTASQSGSNAVVSNWNWSASTQILTQTGFAGADTIRGSSVRDVINGLDGDNRLFGLAGNDTLTSGSGSDFLDGGTGADKMTGGGGNDTYLVDVAQDVIVEALDGGSDTVFAFCSYTLGANLEALQIFGSGFTAIGNDLSNTIFGDGVGPTIINGHGGSDYMVGGSGNDVLNGGTGIDTAYGGLGNDTYYIDDPLDFIGESANEGTDTVRAAFTYTLADNFENLTLDGTAAIDGTGNGADNLITGNAAANTLVGFGGNDTLNGGAGNDTMTGGTGDDIYYVDSASDSVTELFNEGTDAVRTGLSYTLGANVENLTLLYTGQCWGLGNGLNNVITGNIGGNVLRGYGGNDTLDGGQGADAMTGGIGNDTYVVDNAGDTVTELAGEGIDTVRTGLSYVLGANVENLTLIYNGKAWGTGNELGNTLVGNISDNVLRGLAGNDTLTGGLGADAFVFNTPLNAATNVDTITDFSVSQGDVFWLDDAVFKALAPGALPAGDFVTGTAAANTAQNIVYDGGTGSLFYDADGLGGAAQVKFASVTPGIALTASQFVVI